MILITDIHYADDAALVGIVAVKQLDAETAVCTYRIEIPGVPAEYEPGSFWKRELPPLLQALQAVPDPYSVVVVDGFASLGAGRPGLGQRLCEALGSTISVVGIAKNHFAGCDAVPVLRGDSKSPIYVSVDGDTDKEAWAAQVQRMSGANRLPYLVKLADHLARGYEPPMVKLPSP